MTIDPNLEAIIKSMQTSCETTATGITGEDLRAWMNFADVLEVGKFELEKLSTLFNRVAANEDYMNAKTKEAKAKDICVPKLTVDILAGIQRDYSMRMRSRIRIFSHGAAIHKSNGSGAGPLRRNSIDVITRIAGGDYSNA